MGGRGRDERDGGEEIGGRDVSRGIKGEDGMVGEYRRWEERIGKGVGEGRVMQWDRGDELRRREGKVR